MCGNKTVTTGGSKAEFFRGSVYYVLSNDVSRCVGKCVWAHQFACLSPGEWAARLSDQGAVSCCTRQDNRMPWDPGVTYSPRHKYCAKIFELSAAAIVWVRSSALWRVVVWYKFTMFRRNLVPPSSGLAAVTLLSACSRVYVWNMFSTRRSLCLLGLFTLGSWRWKQ
jgi:hypothetical protein